MTIPRYEREFREQHEERTNIMRLQRQRLTRVWDRELQEKELVYDLQMEITPKDAEEAIEYVREFYNPGAEEFEDPNVFRMELSKIVDEDTGEFITSDIGFIRKPLELWRVPPGQGAKAQASKLRNIIEFLEDSYFRLKNTLIKEQATKGFETVISQGFAHNKPMDLDTSPDSNQISIFLDAANAVQFKKAEINLEFEEFYPIAKMENYPLNIPNNALNNAIESKKANDLLIGGLLKNAEDNIRSYDHQYALANVGKTLQDYINDKADKYKQLLILSAGKKPRQLLLEDKRTTNKQTREKTSKLTKFKSRVTKTVESKFGALKEVIGQLTPEERKSLSTRAFLRMIGYGVQMRYSYLNSETIKSPEVMFGPLLLFSIQMVERAKSDRKLKNRALGNVFLAHQKGNRDIVRIDGTLIGPQRFVMLALMIKLQRDGEGYVSDLADKGGIVFEPMAPPASAETQQSEKQQFNYEEHRTMPLVTRTHVMLNMYLQTIEWHRSVEDGQDIIKYHLLFRKHVPSTAWRAFNPQKYTNDEGKPVAGAGYQLLDSRAKVRRWLEYSLDLAWKLERSFGETYLHMLINNDGSRESTINEGFNNVNNVVTGYQGNLLGVF